MDRSRENLEFQQDLELLLAEVRLLAATEENRLKRNLHTTRHPGSIPGDAHHKRWRGDT